MATDRTLEFEPVNLDWECDSGGGTTVFVTGWACIDGVTYRDEALASIVLQQLNDRELSAVLRAMNGTFAIVVDTPDAIQAATDRSRTIPLFYRVERDVVRVSDNIEPVATGESLRHRGLVEYATAGLVTRHYTVYEKVYGVQAGEAVTVSNDEDDSISRTDYYRYLCSYDDTAQVEELCEELDGKLTAVWNYLTEELGGRQVVIPLSGGLDSRLVASMFRRSGYQNVLCYSYGRPDNEEAKTSRRVADQLEYPWTFIEYSGDMWGRILASEEMYDYWQFAANGVSLPHINDWPAVRLMTSEELIDDDAVFVPGHTGDFLSGGHLAYLLDPHYAERPGDLVSAIVEKHYSRWVPLLTDENTSVIEEEIAAYESALDGESAPTVYEFWEWRERQAKYILNSLRVYEFFDYDWRVPLWDPRLMEFWRGIPIEQKVNQNLYVHYLTTRDPTGVYAGVSPPGPWEPDDSPSAEEANLADRLREWARETPLDRLFQHYRHLVYYRNRPLGIGRSYGVSYVLRHPGKRHHESLILRDVMMDLYGVDPLDLE